MNAYLITPRHAGLLLQLVFNQCKLLPSIDHSYLSSNDHCKELHVFMDASKKGHREIAYIYLDSVLSLIMSKARAAPLK